MYQCFNWAIHSKKCSIKAPVKWRNSVYVLTEICHQRSKRLGSMHSGPVLSKSWVFLIHFTREINPVKIINFYHQNVGIKNSYLCYSIHTYYLYRTLRIEKSIPRATVPFKWGEKVMMGRFMIVWGNPPAQFQMLFTSGWQSFFSRI